MSHHSHHQVNARQYQDKFDAYATSAVHAQGIEFAHMRTLITQHGADRVLDLGTGGGHVSYQVADITGQVVAYDLSAQMVENVVKTAHAKGLANVTGQVGAAERLAFADGSFDMVITRFSAHHWQSVPQALDEIYRVLSPSGVLVIVDILGHTHPVINNFLQTIETIRDPSHVRDYALSEWLAMTERANFTTQSIQTHRILLEFGSWIARMDTPAQHQAVILSLQCQASDMVKDYYDIQPDGSFMSDVGDMVFTKFGS